MEKTTFDEKQSMDVIRQMISNAQYNISESAVYFIVWGTLITVAAIAQYVLIITSTYFNYLYMWGFAIGLGIAFTIYKSISGSENKQRKTFADQAISGLWTGSSGMFILITLIGVTHNWLLVYPVFMAVYGWGCFASGYILKFKPLILGGIAAFLCAFAAVFVQNEAILLILAASLISSFIIPGVMLKKSTS